MSKRQAPTYPEWLKAVTAHLLEAEAGIYYVDQAESLYAQGYAPADAAVELCRIDGA